MPTNHIENDATVVGRAGLLSRAAIDHLCTVAAKDEEPSAPPCPNDQGLLEQIWTATPSGYAILP
jgi:hypothetical protein